MLTGSPSISSKGKTVKTKIVLAAIAAPLVVLVAVRVVASASSSKHAGEVLRPPLVPVPVAVLAEEEERL